MKNFDEETQALEDVTKPFIFKGVEFVGKPRMSAKHFSALTDVASSKDAGQMYEVYVAAIRDSLQAECREAWDAVLEQDHNVPISLNQLDQIATFLIEETTGRPPTPPTPSGSTGENGSTKSTDGFASTAAPALPPSIPALD